MGVNYRGEAMTGIYNTRYLLAHIMHYHKSFSFWGRNMIIINQTFELTLGCPHMELWVINNPWLWTYPFYGFKHSCLDPLFDVYCAEIILRWETPGPVIQLCCWHPRPPQIIENIQCVSFTPSDSVFIHHCKHKYSCTRKNDITLTLCPRQFKASGDIGMIRYRMFLNVFNHFLPYLDGIWGPFFCRLSWFRHHWLLWWFQVFYNNPFPYWVSKYNGFLITN